jgi:CHRD domain-containing protein
MVATRLRRLRSHARAASALVLAALLPLAASAADNFKVRLAPVPIDSTTAAATTGSGSATAQLDGSKLRLTGSFAGLKGAATVARLHDGVATGVRGPAIADFTVPQATSGSFSAELALTPAQADSVRRGKAYIQIHSATAPDGNLWGWLLP